MLQLLITYQPSAPSIAYGRALLRPQGAAPVGGVAAGAARAAAAVAAGPPPAANAAVNRRRATVSIVINLEAMLSLVVPLFLLSLKLGFLLWIFGRHASYTKRLVMGGMAAAWIVWEGWGMYRRRAVVGVMRERVERERERAERQARRVEMAAQAGVQLPAAVARHLPPPLPAAQAGGGGGGGGELRQRLPAGPPRIGRPPGAPRPRIREPHSRLSPRYWIARIATIGLVEEAHELGLAPRTVAGRPAAPPAPRLRADDRMGLARAARRRVLRTIVVAVVLFFGTLSPEVERKRRRALEKRERLLAERRVWRERIMAERAAVGAAPVGGAGAEVFAPRLPIGGGLQLPETRSGASTPGLFEGDHEQPPAFPPPSPGSMPAAQPPQPSPSTSLPPPIPSTSTASTSTAPPPIDNQDPTPTTSPAAGRAAVSDAELFADGLGEPEQEPLALPLPGAGAGAGEGEGEGESGTEGEGEGEGEGETETDEEEERRAGAEEGEGEVDQVLVLL